MLRSETSPYLCIVTQQHIKDVFIGRRGLHLKQVHILIVDDDPDVLEVWTETLEEAGYRVTGTHSAREGLRAQRRDPADVIIADVLMPDMDGLELIGKIREEFDGIPVIAVSGGGMYIKGTLCRKLALQIGAAAVLAKPVPARLLLEAISRVADFPKNA
ncbi:MAG: response regulator [Chitinivibrionales bacterium]|nr:response regulator [Chitinivibrionales bacterium]MBD3355896.1 response regulator [Chitinivibrionales bacterium]